MNRRKYKEQIIFQSSLSMEQIESNFAHVDLFSELKTALKQALAYEKGEEVPHILVRTKSKQESTHEK